MSRILMLVAICIFLTTTAIDGNAAPPQPSVSTSVQKSGGDWDLFSELYGYPSYPGTCVSYASRTDQILFSVRVVDASGHDVVWSMQSEPGQVWFPGTFYDAPSGTWYSYCSASISYLGTVGETVHIWTDLGTDGFGYNWVFSDVTP